jgi:hypothetical protein
MGFFLTIFAITSALAIALLVRRRVRGLGAAIGMVLEVIGATTIFLFANLAVGVLLVLAARKLALFYTTLYVVTDEMLLVGSLTQALIITVWRQRTTT